MTQPAENISTAKAPDAVPSGAEGVNMDAAMKAFKEERAKDRAEEAKSEQSDIKEAPAEAETPAETAEPPAESTSVDVPEKDALKVKLRAKTAARQRDIEARELALKQREAEHKAQADALEARNREIAEERSRIEGLRARVSTDPRSVLKELGINLPDVVNAELAEMSPEARSKQMGKMLENLPKLIEEKAQELVAKTLTEREEQARKQASESQRQQMIAQSERAFVERAGKDAEKLPHLAKVASQDSRFAVHTAYYIQSVFQQEHGRAPTDKELDFNVNKYLGDKFFADGASAKAPAKANGGKTSPRASAREVAEKPVAEMSAEERMAAATREFRRVREADRQDD